MQTSISMDSKPCLAREARLRYEEVRKTDMLLLPERVVKLNPTGAAILRLCDGQRTVRMIAQELSAQYGGNNLDEDVLQFLNQVSQQGWIE